MAARIKPLFAAKCLSEGLKLALSPQCRAYVIVPIIVNIILLTGGGIAAYLGIKHWIIGWSSSLPSYLEWLGWILVAIAALFIIFLCFWFFSAIATIIASPFYGLLADRAEMAINGTQSEDTGISGAIRDIPRCLKRELKKQLFFLPRALLCLVITLIPVVNVISPVPWFLLGAWMGCLQYADYAYDNHKISFPEMRADLASSKLATFSLGAIVALLTAVPVLNLIIPPAAVCAGTRYYVELRRGAAAGTALQGRA
jgi:CysZ protein